LVFVENLHHIEQLSQTDSGATFGLTLFSDLTEEEFISLHTGFKKVDTTEVEEKEEIASARFQNSPPESWDWTEHNAVTNVKNQG